MDVCGIKEPAVNPSIGKGELGSRIPEPRIYKVRFSALTKTL